MIGYTGIHERVRVARGRASDHMCVAPGCDAQAKEWALVGEARFSGTRGSASVRWSDDIADYAPTCATHNRQLDGGGDWVKCKRGHLRAEVGAGKGGECRACTRERCRAYYDSRKAGVTR